jgi:hypothetical protein
MRSRSLRGALLLALLVLPPAYAQKATEQFIPIGQSPGISGVETRIGEIVASDKTTLTLQVGDAAEPVTVRLTDKTRIFLDRSKLKQSNLAGTVADLQKGRLAEVRLVGPPEPPAADWVKVEIVQP